MLGGVQALFWYGDFERSVGRSHHLSTRRGLLSFRLYAAHSLNVATVGLIAKDLSSHDPMTYLLGVEAWMRLPCFFSV